VLHPPSYAGESSRCQPLHRSLHVAYEKLRQSYATCRMSPFSGSRHFEYVLACLLAARQPEYSPDMFGVLHADCRRHTATATAEAAVSRTPHAPAVAVMPRYATPFPAKQTVCSRPMPPAGNEERAEPRDCPPADNVRPRHHQPTAPYTGAADRRNAIARCAALKREEIAVTTGEQASSQP